MAGGGMGGWWFEFLRFHVFVVFNMAFLKNFSFFAKIRDTLLSSTL